MRRRPQGWTLEENEDGTIDVRRGNRPVVTGLSSSHHAESVVRLSRRPGERVWYVEPDGYRTEMTRRFPDPAAQRPDPQAAPADPLDSHPVRTRYLNRYRRA